MDLYDELCGLSDPSDDDLYVIECLDCGEPVQIGWVCEECDVTRTLNAHSVHRHANYAYLFDSVA